MDLFEDGLDGELERHSAQMIGQGASIIETLMRRLRANSGRNLVDPTSPDDARGAATPSNLDPITEETGRHPAPLTGAQLAEELRFRHGLDVTRLGNRQYDQKWVDDAEPADVIDLLRSAAAHSTEANRARAVRDNVLDRIGEYGIDGHALLSGSPEEAAQALRDRRETFLDADEDREGTDADAENVKSLMTQAQAADRDADGAQTRANNAEAAAGELSRSDRVRSSGDSSASRDAAAFAARDHPTNPRDAAKAPQGKAPKARRAGQGASRQREHEGR